MSKPRGRLSTEAKIEVELIKGGPRGKDGASIYEIWLEQGNEGTIDDFLDSYRNYNLATNKPTLNGIELIGDVEIDVVESIELITDEDIISAFEGVVEE